MVGAVVRQPSPSILDYAHSNRIALMLGTLIPVAIRHYVMLRRNLIYTGLTRGKRLVVLVGQKRALALAVRTSDEGRRWSKLRDWLANR